MVKEPSKIILLVPAASACQIDSSESTSRFEAGTNGKRFSVVDVVLQGCRLDAKPKNDS